MRFLKSTFVVGLLASAWLARPVVVDAGVITFSRSVPFSTNDFAAPVTFPLFDPALGTPNEARFRMRPSAEGSHGFENTGQTATTAGVRTNVGFRLDDSGDLGLGLLVAGSVFAELVVPSTPPFDGVVDFDGPSGSTIAFDTPGVPPSEFFGVFSTAAELAAFTGPGSFLAELSTMASISPIGGSAIEVTGSSEGAALLNLTYEFEPIPEPGTLFSILLGGLLLLKRRR